uniref:uncharacterized protein LOC109970026 n=1 Tax=Monopterus albus TaxID=43700 RepID=UPI0009B30324|nr:uncharacterized protein LOC109970026 [Monopterus albus]
MGGACDSAVAMQRWQPDIRRTDGGESAASSLCVSSTDEAPQSLGLDVNSAAEHLPRNIVSAAVVLTECSSAMSLCEDREEGGHPSESPLCGDHESQSTAPRRRQQRPDCTEPSCMYMTRVQQQNSEVHSDQSAQQHQPDLDSIFMLLEETMVTFVKNELKKIQKVLRPDYPECLESLWEDEEELGSEDEERRRSSRESFLRSQ